MSPEPAAVARGIGVTTALSGAGLVLAPRLSLRAMGAGTAGPAPLLFRVVGMFMVVCGGLLVDAAGDEEPDRRVLRWSLVQKLGATAAMALGVRAGHYRPRALAVAAFDGASAAALAWLLASGRRAPGADRAR